VSNLALAVAGGRVELDGRVTPRLDLTASARALPLSVVDAFKPGTGLAGVLDAQARLTGAPDAPQGPWRVAIQRFSAPPLKANGVAPATLEARGELSGDHTSLEARFAAGRDIDLKASGRAPLSADGALDLGVTGKVDLSLANRQIAAAGRRLSGVALIDARLTGRASAPAVAGGAQLSGGAFSDDESGVKLTNIAARVTGDANRILIRDVSARARNGGTVTASGEVRLDAGAGFPGQIEIRANEAELMASDVATAVANARVSLSGPLARRPAIAGRVDFTRLDVTIPERLPGNYQPIAKAKHIAPPPQVRARLAKQAKAKKGKGGRPAPAFDATLDLVIAAANRVFVRGRGVDSELAGELKLTGSLADPVPVGGFELRRGRIAVAGKRLDFTRGRVAFTGSLTPDLDFLAATQAVDATLQIALNGPANEPNFAFSSEPSLPDEEILSRLLFNKASGGLSAGQALQLALVAAQFASGGGGDAFERVRKQFGLDSLDVNLGSGGVGVGASKAINERLSVGVRAGSTPADTGVSVDFDATRNIRLRGEATSDGAAGIGLGFEKEY
jgi:translocation and assembly module TamB